MRDEKRTRKTDEKRCEHATGRRSIDLTHSASCEQSMCSADERGRLCFIPVCTIYERDIAESSVGKKVGPSHLPQKATHTP